MTDVSLILGTAGHIDHGKTSLVKALTGVDTDRLAEEKKRGITIELGFARFAPSEGRSFGVVDVPGHEGFIRTMVAGATGMDVVLLVVAADEGVMPQTREHLSIVGLLGVGALVVALTKVDLVEEEWLELVEEEVRELLAPTPWAGAPIVPTSVADGTGIEALSEALASAAEPTAGRSVDDVARLPADRVFTVEGAGTVVTGTLWSGSLAVGQTVRLLPLDEEARIRRLQVHGEDVDTAQAGQRTAVALTGTAVRRGLVERGYVLVTDGAWRTTMMLTVHLNPLSDTGWSIEHGQRVRVHLGTTEVMARIALLGDGEGERPLVAQLRLESPLVARTGDPFVVRSYSPMTTIAGGVVLEPSPPKRKRLSREVADALGDVARGGADALRGAASLGGWEGLPVAEVAIRAGRSPGPVEGVVRVGDAWFAASRVEDGEARLLRAVAAHHRDHPLDPGIPLESLRTALPRRAAPDLAEGLIRRLADRGDLRVDGRHARRPDFVRELSGDQEKLRQRLREVYTAAALQPPGADELPHDVAGHPDLAAVLGLMVEERELAPLGESHLMWRMTLENAASEVVRDLGGRTGLGPSDFKNVLPVTRKHLIPLLTWLDTEGITLRRDGSRSVVEAWGEAQSGGSGVSDP